MPACSDHPATFGNTRGDKEKARFAETGATNLYIWQRNIDGRLEFAFLYRCGTRNVLIATNLPRDVCGSQRWFAVRGAVVDPLCYDGHGEHPAAELHRSRTDAGCAERSRSRCAGLIDRLFARNMRLSSRRRSVIGGGCSLAAFSSAQRPLPRHSAAPAVVLPPPRRRSNRRATLTAQSVQRWARCSPHSASSCRKSDPIRGASRCT